MDIQKLAYFAEGNTFTGSASKDPRRGLVLRYRAEPDLENRRLAAHAWTKDLCFERAGETQRRDFPLSQEGLEQLCAWLQEQYDAL